LLGLGTDVLRYDYPALLLALAPFNKILPPLYYQDGDCMTLRLHPALAPFKAAVWARDGNDDEACISHAPMAD
jgi:hypothetical protein